MKQLFLLLFLIILAKNSTAQAPDFCNKLASILLSMKDNKKNFWGEKVQADSYTTSYKSKTSLVENNKEKASFFHASNDYDYLGYREDIYLGKDSAAGHAVYKKYWSLMEKCTGFKLEEAKDYSYKYWTVSMFYDRFKAKLEFSTEGFGSKITVAFIILPTEN